MSGEKSEISTKPPDDVQLGSLRFLLETNELKGADGATLRLRRQSTEVLGYLAARAGQLVSKAELIEHVWPDTFVTDDSLGQCISDIRRTLGDSDHRIIQTYPKQGYMLVPMEPQAGGRDTTGTGRRLRRRVAMALLVGLGTTVTVLLTAWLWRSPPAQAGPPPLPVEPSVVVLPFDNQSYQGDLDYLAAGLSTSIRTQLSKFPQLFIIAGSTSVTFKDRPGTARGIGRELGVRYVLDGSIRKLGEGLSVSVELIEAETEQTIWAEQYHLSVDTALGTQADVVQEIVGTLNVVVSEEELAAVRARPTGNPRAYDLFLQAEAASALLTPEGRSEAVRLLHRAIELDPDFLAAHFELSGRYLSLFRFGGAQDTSELVRLSRHHAERALEISRSDYRGHFRMGMLHLFADHDHDLALLAFKRALKDNPNDADVLYNMGFLRALMGEPAEAIAWNDRAKRINPRYPGWYNFNAAQSHYFLGQYREAEALARSAIAEYPRSLPPRRILIVTLVETGRLKEAQQEAMKLLEINPDFRLSTFRNTPFQHEADQIRYFGAMRAAGIPD